jgi:hypothetical protein
MVAGEGREVKSIEEEEFNHKGAHKFLYIVFIPAKLIS